MGSGRKNSLLIALMLAVPIVLSGCGSKAERMAEHLKKAKDYYAQADYDKARVESKNVLQLDPKNAEAYYLSGEIEEQQQAWPKAYANYLKAVEVDPTYLPAKAKLGRIYLLMGETAKAEKMVNDILTKQPNDAAGQTLKAALMMHKGDIDGAISEVSRVVAADPSQDDAVSLLVFLYSKQGNDAKAQTVLEQGMQASPKNVALRQERANFALKYKDFAKAEQLYQSIVSIDPKKLEYRATLASFYARNNQLDKAEAVLREAIKADPEDQKRGLLLAEFLASRRSGVVAEKELLNMIRNAPESKSYQLRFGLAKLYEAMGKPDKALQVYQDIARLDKTGPDGTKASGQSARLQLAAGKIPEAEKIISDILKVNPQDNDALLLRGKIELGKKDAKDAIIDFRSVLKAQPDSVELISLLAKAHLLNNEPQLARDTFDNAVSLYPDKMDIRFARADFLGSIGDYDGALKDVDAVLVKDPKNLGAIQTKVKILATQKDWPSAEAYLSKVKEALPDQPIGYYWLGMIYQAQKENDKAAIEFESALQKSPQSTEALSALVNALVAQGKVDQAISRLNLVLKSAPNNFAAYQLLGDIYANQKKYAEAGAAFSKGIQLAPKNPVAYVDLAKLGLMRGDSKTAIQVLQQGLVAIPDNIQLMASLAEIYQTTSDYDKAIAEYENILKIAPGMDVVANNLASILTDVKGDKASLARAAALAKRFENSDNPVYLDTLGWIYVKSGEYDLAQPILEKAVGKAPKISIFQYHLGMLFYKKGDMKSAKMHLQQAVSAKTAFPGIEEAKGILAKI